MQEADILVPVAHFSKEVFSTFGSPFLVLLTQGDTVGSVKQKIQDKVGVSWTNLLRASCMMNKIDFAFLRHVSRSCFDEFNLLSDISQNFYERALYEGFYTFITVQEVFRYIQ